MIICEKAIENLKNMDNTSTQLQMLADNVNLHPATLVMRAIDNPSSQGANPTTTVKHTSHSLFIYNTFSLHLIKHEFMQGLKDLEVFLADYTQDFDIDDVTTNTDVVITQAQELAAAAEFIGLCGAAELLAQMPAALQKLLSNPTQKLAEDLSVAVMLSQLYMQFSLNMQALAPQLLMDITNTIEAHLQQPLSSEGLYLKKFITLEQQCAARKPAKGLSMPELTQASQQLQQVYQHHLLGLFATEASPTSKIIHAQTIEKTTRTAYELCAGLPDEQFWYAASVALQQLDIQQVLTMQRKRVLLGIGRQMARLGTMPSDQLWYDVLAKAMTRESPAALDLRAYYNVHNRITSDANIEAIKHQMFGPSSATVQMVVDTLLADLQHIKEQLDHRFEPLNLEQTMQNMGLSLFDVANIIEFVISNDALPASIKQLAGTLCSMKQPPDEGFVAQLMTLLTQAENALLLTARKHTTAGALLPVGNIQISQAKVEEAFNQMITEAQSSIFTAIAGLVSFSKNPGQSVHLDNVPAILEGLYGATLFLLNYEASAALHRLHQILVRKIQHTTEAYRIKIANGCIEILTYIDYYFSNVANKMPVGALLYNLIDAQLQDLESSYNLMVQV